MATGQSLLDLCEDLDRELQLQSGEADVARGLRALNAAQDYLEGLLAQHPDVFGGQTANVSTANNTESSAFPAGFLRIDRLQYLDASTSRPAWDLEPIKRVGGHAWSRAWPLYIVTTTSGGKPRGYWTNGTNIYWDPLPDGTHTVRCYGFKTASDLTAGGTFAYPDLCMLALATFAVKVLRIGVDDPTPDYTALANDLFTPLLATLANFNRDGAAPLQYRYGHDT